MSHFFPRCVLLLLSVGSVQAQSQCRFRQQKKWLLPDVFSGIGAGFLKEQIFAFSNESTSTRPSPVNQNSVTSIPRTISCALPDLTLSSEGNWGLSFQEEGKTPIGNASIQELASMDAYYAQDTSEK